MKMYFSGEFGVDLPKTEVYALLSDPEQFAPLLPGFHSMEMKDANTALIRARVGIGKIGGIASTELNLGESRTAAPCRIHRQGQAHAGRLHLAHLV